MQFYNREVLHGLAAVDASKVKESLGKLVEYELDVYERMDFGDQMDIFVRLSTVLSRKECSVGMQRTIFVLMIRLFCFRKGCFSATVPDSFAVFIDATTELPQPCRFATLAHLCACIDSSTSLPDLSTAESLTIQDQNHISATIFPPSAIFLYLSCIICIVSYQFTLAILLLYVGQSPRLLTRYLVFTTINATEPEAEPDLTDIPKPLRETLQELKDLLEFEDLSPETRAWVSERLDHM